ncbi:FMN-binding negative transcriptional regulator [Nocardia sp. NBC_01499]|uniref:FMN-binding negative transcriptional regulator n=1 Tax=Nocardia sp. NBC_01499 TaxID=2903597 RepID=UPI0038653A65
MFVPAQYRTPDSSWLVELLRRNPLALLLTNGRPGEVPYATHLPVIFRQPPPAEPPPELSGTVLLGHLNRANPHWRALSSSTDAVLVFTGPHAYVSPTVYRTEPAAPTWNYTAVHVHGRLQKIGTAVETMEVVKSTVRAYEDEFGAGWDMSGSIEYFEKLLPAVGAFRFVVSHTDGMFKLSQEQEPAVRERVVSAFMDRGSCPHRETAELMKRLA